MSKLRNLFEATKKALKRTFSKGHEMPEAFPQEGSDIVINDYSQPHVLKYRMQDREMTHDQKVLADLCNVRLAEREYAVRGQKTKTDVVLYFCPMEYNDLKIKQHINEGDSTPLPYDVILNGLKGPKDLNLELDGPGKRYNLKNVVLHSNGAISITPTAVTVWEEVME